MKAAANQDSTTQVVARYRRRARLLLAGVLVVGVAVLSAIALESGVSAESSGSGPEITSPRSQEAPALRGPSTNYPISGFFITASTSDSENYKKLSDIKTFGGDTIITFGTTLKPVTLASIPSGCVLDSDNCARVASGSLTVERYFTYLDGSNWDTAALRCPNDRKVTAHGQSFVVMVIPRLGGGCTPPNSTYDVVVVGGGNAKAADSSKSLALAATKLGMKYFAGLPAPSKRTDLTYLPDLSYADSLSRFTDRYLQYQASTNNVPGLAGFYHHTEMPLTDNRTFDSVIALYASQNRSIHRALPTRQAIVSPYIDARVARPGTSVNEARNGARRIAQTSAGLQLNIAVQDGMGTGKGGAFNKADASSAVDPFAASIVGEGTWGRKYLAPNRDYFAAAAAGTTGTDAVLWANIEGMAPATKSNPCGDSFRGQTSKARIDRQLQQVGNVKKVVSYMWDSYFTCEGTGTSLRSQIEAVGTTPIITDTTFRPGIGRLQIVGFNLRGASATLKWTAPKGTANETTARAVSINAAFGLENGMNPKLEMVIVDFGPIAVGPAATYSTTVTNESGAKSAEFRAKLD